MLVAQAPGVRTAARAEQIGLPQEWVERGRDVQQRWAGWMNKVMKLAESNGKGSAALANIWDQQGGTHVRHNCF